MEQTGLKTWELKKVNVFIFECTNNRERKKNEKSDWWEKIQKADIQIRDETDNNLWLVTSLGACKYVRKIIQFASTSSSYNIKKICSLQTWHVQYLSIFPTCKS